MRTGGGRRAKLHKMPPKTARKLKDKDHENSPKISSFFSKSPKPAGVLKRARAADEDDSPEPKKTPWASPTPLSPTQSSSAGGQLSPEQLARMEKKKLEAGARLLAKRLGTSNIGPSWVQALQAEFKKTYMEKLISFVAAERLKGKVYPPADDVFTWTTAFPISQVKVVIIGQDPYHGPKQAHGLCFSVRVGVQIPPSLRNMYKELMQDIDGFVPPDHGYLAGWAKQGVLLLNACLTVREREPNSHKEKVREPLYILSSWCLSCAIRVWWCTVYSGTSE
ncbi:Uracil-DNA glycosylase [Geodia barretti]|uniref:Uracil-DNA glycosylase n=1 Tax=Geodia barretti TaxID=519541 RepID=A0AA35QVG3_GEOBA|nr:Uracil-DNA glycosylase [Geodia barretti]